MRTFTFTTPEIETDLVLPVAKELWYQEFIETTESFSNQTEVVEWAVNTKEFTQEDGTKLYSYNVVTSTANTQTIDEFMQTYFKIEFLRNKIMPAIVTVKTAVLEEEKKAKELELEQAKKLIEDSLINN